MLTLLRTLVLLPIAVIVVLFAVANRAPVTLSLDPFAKGAPEIGVNLPLYALLFAAMTLGILLGGVGTWAAAGRNRQAGRVSRREAHRLRAEADRLRAAVAASRQPALPAPRSATS